MAAVARGVPAVNGGDAALISTTPEWADLVKHKEEIDKTHLRDLITDAERCKALTVEYNGVYCDYARQRVTPETMKKLYALADAADLKGKINAMFSGEHINSTEDRAVLHVATRAPKDKVINVDGKNVVPDVHEVLDKIKDFTDKVRNGEWVGATGKPLTSVVAVGIGGSFLGPLFVHTSLKNVRRGGGGRARASTPVPGERRPRGCRAIAQRLGPRNHARGCRVEDVHHGGDDAQRAHRAAMDHRGARARTPSPSTWSPVSTNLKLVSEFGIDPDNAFAFWDWVGGRYSVCSAVGMLPLSLQYGYETMSTFLEGAWNVDEHFATAPFEENLPVTLGMLSLWNVSFLDCPARAILPYTQALAKLAPHIQQVAMESNGKGVSIDGPKAGLRNRRDRFRRARHERPALVLPAHPPGTNDPVRLHRHH
jgi:glucose-6-phosphate isomerase